MKELTCSTKCCKNKVKYQNDLEESFYCKDCAFTMFNLNELTKIGKISDINKMIKVNEGLLEKIRIYISIEKLEHKWRLTLEELKFLEDQLLKIKDDTENSLKTDNSNNLAKIQQRLFDLKFRITESEIYRKYLLHKDMNELRLQNDNSGISISQIIQNMVDIRVQKERIETEEKVRKLNNLKQVDSNIDKPELKMTYIEENEELKQHQLNDKESNENEKEDRLEITEIKDEHSTSKDKINDSSELPQSLSYDEFTTIRKKYTGESEMIDQYSCFVFTLSEKSIMNLVKELSVYKLPPVNYYILISIPEDSEDVRNFMRNSINTITQFYFTPIKQIDCSNYFKELKQVASRTTLFFSLDKIKLTFKQFCEIVSAAKQCIGLKLDKDLILLDSECDFGPGMEECKIEKIEFECSSGDKYDSWSENLARFDNLAAAISKCKPLAKSLKKLSFLKNEMIKEKAEEILKKYHLNEIQIILV